MRVPTATLLTITTLVGIALVTYHFGTTQHTTKQIDASKQQKAQEQVAKLLEEKHPNSARKALQIIDMYSESFLRKDEIGRTWTKLFITASLQAKSIAPLVTLYGFSPEALDSNEEAALQVGEALIQLQRNGDYVALSTRWNGRKGLHHEWLFLDAMNLAEQGRISEADAILNSQTYSGSAETHRLVHLGMLHVKRSPQKAWDYLTAATQYDAGEPKLRLLRGQLLENYGKAELARAEYLAAAAQQPANMELRDTLAEFYRRQGSYNRALATWLRMLETAPEEETWVKMRFWSLVVQDVNLDWSPATSGQPGPQRPLVEYLTSLSEGTFWNETTAQETRNLPLEDPMHQSLFWLRLIQHLKDGKETAATELLAARPYQGYSWHPELERALTVILAFRETGELPAPSLAVRRKYHHLFFRALLQQPREGEQHEALLTLLKGEEAFSAAFLAAGWREAALELSSSPALPEGIPPWLSYHMTQALHLNRGPEAAIEYATRQRQAPALQLLQGEIMISAGKVEDGVRQLHRFATMSDPIGLRAAWLLSNLYIAREEYSAAKSVVMGNDSLQKSLNGRETLARIAHLEGSVSIADALYEKMKDESSEAKSYLARKAFEGGDLLQAKKLTEELLHKHPNDITIRKNFKAILERLAHEQ